MDISDILETIWYFLGRGYRNPRRGFVVGALLLAISSSGFWALNLYIDDIGAVKMVVSWFALALMLVLGAVTLIGVLIRVAINVIKRMVG